jgi:hypothetical protein
MSTLPKLALIPSGYKGGTNPTVYSILPNNGDGDFTFSRTSNATRVNKNGLIETVDSNVPRLDYSDSNCPSLLLEPQRTNLITYSEDLSNGAWVKSTSNVSGGIISPKGDTSAYLVNFTTGASSIYSSATVTPTTNYTFTFYCKNVSLEEIQLAVYDETNSAFISSNVSYLSSLIDNEWVRISYSFTTPAGCVSARVYPQRSSSLLGIGSAYFWGLQLEAGSYQTSYIPTTSSAATRIADLCNNAGNSTIFNDSEGVLYAEIKSLGNDVNSREISLSDGTLNNRIEIRYFAPSNTIQGVVRVENGSIVFAVSTSLYDITEFNKVAVKYKQDNFSMWVNGVLVGTDTAGNTPVNLKELAFDDGSGSLVFHGNCKDLRVYNTALTDAELQALTTL